MDVGFRGAMRIAVASRPKLGERANGDVCYYRKFDDNLLICLMDGAGHGEAAQVVARKTVDYFERNHDLDLVELTKGCHEELKGTRGGVMGLALIQDGLVSYVGVGNIRASLSTMVQGETERKVSFLTSLGGIVGYNLRKVMQFQYPYEHGSTLVMLTDGIFSGINIADYVGDGGDPKDIANRILRECSKDDDDATVVVASD
ncbi:MAG: SpoIIE family protein phosphatase [Chloroflexota bacterium]|nr:SpoIIE family protein phosphatase [Chloroflexota bacterium]